MTDGVSPAQDVRFMSDDALKQELAAPTGVVPGYLVMGEMQDRQNLRAGSGKPPQQSMKDQMLAQPTSDPSRQYSRGGMIGQLNPFNMASQVMQNPKLAASFAQDQMNSQAGGLPALGPAQAAGAPAAPPTLSSLQPTPSGAPQQPQMYMHGGIASLRR